MATLFIRSLLPARSGDEAGDALLLAKDRGGGRSEHGGFSYWVGVAFTVNYIMGCGFLAVPDRFVEAGYVLGPLVIALFVVLMNVSKDFILEAMGRAEAVSSAPSIVARLQAEAASAEGGASAMPSSPPASLLPAPDDYLVTSRKFEIADLFSLFLGRRARVGYVLVLSGYMYGALWAYGTVFAASFASNVPVASANGGHTCDINNSDSRAACLPVFNVWLGVFALLAVPLACLELREQVAVQVCMFTARILVVLLMCGSIISGWAGCAHGGVVFADMGPSTGGPAPGALPFRFSGLPALLPVCTYAFIYHHSIPPLSQPIKDKRSLPSLFRTALLVCAAAYGVLGLIVSLGLGDNVNAQCNLNWQNYVGCVPARASGAPAVTAGDASGLALAIRFVILIFPALDVLSAYPLNALTLGNNLMCACLGDGELAAVMGGGEEVAQGGAALAWYVRTPRLRLVTRTAFRLLAAVPPIVAGALSTSAGIDLDHILRFTGLIGVAIAFGIPALLALVSFAKSRRVFADVTAAAAAEAGGEAEVGADYDHHARDGGESSSAEPLVGAATSRPSRAVDAALHAPLSWRDLFMYDATRPQAEATLRHTPYTSFAVARVAPTPSVQRADEAGGVGAMVRAALRGDNAMAVFSVIAAAYILQGLVVQ